jgi:hypothetical protein
MTIAVDANNIIVFDSLRKPPEGYQDLEDMFQV